LTLAGGCLAIDQPFFRLLGSALLLLWMVPAFASLYFLLTDYPQSAQPAVSSTA
jgi:hypothetical protein